MRAFAPHERAEIFITAELGPWYRLIHTNHIEGYIRWSNDKAHEPGAKMSLLNAEIIHYPTSQEFGDEHYVARTQTNRYFLLRKAQLVER